MNAQINHEAIKQLENLKAEQAKLERLIEVQTKIAKNDLRKVEARTEAEKNLQRNIRSIERRLDATAAYINELKEVVTKAGNVNDLVVEWFDAKESVIPSTYIYTETGETDSWKGEPIVHEYKDAKISYKGYRIYVKLHEVYSGTWSSRPSSEYKMIIASKPDGYISYEDERKFLKNAKTVIKNIDTRIEQINAKVASKERAATAMDLALEFIKANVPSDAMITSNLNDYKTSSNYGSSRPTFTEYQSITVKFANGNMVKYSVCASRNEQGFSLGLVEKIDNEYQKLMKELSSDATRMLSYLS